MTSEETCQTDLNIAFLAILLTRPIIHSAVTYAKIMGKYNVGVCRPSLTGSLPSGGVFAHTALYPNQQLFLVNA